ncbi:NitT/TauT family transport system ATP-binding protein [Streptomyces sp. Ag109_O5-1]|uniref:ABC transporter ATP-binding protein n=1 Tax=Streptomyces sp. Ag109_O5-1 TaxID=1938851 RepID=UPI000F5061E1|nr:ABC transporter ATP-binding protein [Streptomyces sp. Ag109_O5-1]RPE43089.1 NitT/TauT family transport system ATP-binding protein [Streptomyces sp. Ag109_O5-1]
MLRLDSVSRHFGGRPVLDGISLTVPDGQLLSVVGPSGCGKSTLLRAIAGLLPAQEGTITVDGTPVTGVPERLAVVFQEYGRSLLPWLTVRDNVALPLRRRGLTRAARRAEAETILGRVGLHGAARRHPRELSGGMQQRVAIARALVCRPSLLLMDEPFGSLDAGTREDLEDLLLEVHRTDDTTIVFVTHDIDESVYVGDRVVVLSPGPGSHVVRDLPVALPRERDQITTRSSPVFVALRTEVGRAVRGTPPGGPPPVG